MINKYSSKRKTQEEAMLTEILEEISLSPEIMDAFLAIDRKKFVPHGFYRQAYKLDALPIGAKQFISSPLTVAKMTNYLNPKGADSVLEIGCGSGYQAAILSRLIRRVFTVERIDNLITETKKRFKELGLININLKYDDGQNGWKQFAPFDRILYSATAKEIPQIIFDQLSNNGILVAPILENTQEIIKRYIKKGNTITEESLERCSFVPVLDGVQS